MMPRFSCVLFDVDGTLVDSAPVVIDAFEEALSRAGLPVPSRGHLRRYVGPPLWHSFGDLGYSDDQLSDLVHSYRQIYTGHFLEPKPFPGVLELVAHLHDQGIPIATATSKQEPMAVAQLEHLGVSQHFDAIAGATPDPASTKATVIGEALSRLKARGHDVSAPVLVGDSVWDVQGAHEAGIPVIGVGWGYAGDDGLNEAEERCDSVEELAALLLG